MQPGYGGFQQQGYGGPSGQQQGGSGGQQQGNNGGGYPQQQGQQQGGFGGGFPQQQAGVAPNLGCRVELFFKCFNLKNKDNFSKSDPFVKIELQMKGQKYEVGRTETIGNNLNPQFKKGVPVDYQFEVNQELVFTVLDEDPQFDDIIGTAKCSLASIICSKGIYTLPLTTKNGAASGSMQITYEKQVSSKRSLTFQINATNVKDIEVFSKSDPFLRILKGSANCNPSIDPKSIASSDWTQSHETEFIKDNLNPVFKEFTLDTNKLCRDNPNLPLRFELWDHSNRGEHKILGATHITLARMLQGERQFDTVDAKGKFSGKIIVNTLTQGIEYDIIDYVRSGLQLNLTVSIDFTGSNGDPKSSSSLHYINPSGQPNQYQDAIAQVGKIIIDYDTDKMIPAFGFGALVAGKHSDCFPINNNPANPSVKSWEGILQAYGNCIKAVQLNGPTNFAPTIKAMKAVAQGTMKQTPLIYHILMILTDGQITDEQETKDTIIDSQDLPMSIIIIGVGNDDFGNMSELDGDTGGLNGSGNKKGAKPGRDIVQFVRYQDYKGNPYMLAEAVLKELPGQVNRFYSRMGIVPR